MKWILSILFLTFFCADGARAGLLPYASVTVNSPNQFTFDLASTQTVDGIVSCGTNYTFTPSWASTSSWGTNPLASVVMTVGNTSPATTYAGQQWVPYDACFVNGQFNSGSTIESSISIRCSPLPGRYVTLTLVTNQNWTATNAFWTIVNPPTNLKWDCFTNFIHGFVGTSFGNVDAVVPAASSSGGGLLQCGYDLSYYLSELEGAPVPLILASQTNLYSGVIYRVQDLQSLAPNYATQEANIANGYLPTNVTVNIQGTREVDFTGWPYQDVYCGVVAFLEKQGVRWLHPDEASDYIPYGGGVSLSSLPINFKPVVSLYANFDLNAFYPWPVINGTPRQGYLYWIRRHWTSSENGLLFVGGSEIQYESAPGGLNGNYSEAFTGYPHNFNQVVPSRIMEMTGSSVNGVPVDTNWWGFQGGVNVNPTTGVYDGSGPYQLTWSQTSSNLIKWVAQKVIAVDTAAPLDSVSPLTYKAWIRYYGLLPIDATLWSSNAQEVALDSPYQPGGDGWVNASGAFSYSPQYYYMVTNVANDVTLQGGSQSVMALAYANVNSAPPNFSPFPKNVHVQVCLYGQPVLPTASQANLSISNNWVKWNALTTNLGCYDYQLLQVDFSQQNPMMMIPEVSGMVDRTKFLEGEGVNEAGCQAFAGSGSSYGMTIYNPWNFYAYPATWWDKNQTATNLLNQFFNDYYQESGVPLLSFYNDLEQGVITNNIGMHSPNGGYAQTIVPGTFTFPVLYAMQTNLTLAYAECTNYFTLQRLNVISNQFAWTINQLNLGGTNLNNPGQFSGVPTNVTMVIPASLLLPNPGIPGACFATNEEANGALQSSGIGGTNTWVLQSSHSSVQSTFYFTNSGYYQFVVYGGYNFGSGGLCRITVGANSGDLLFTNLAGTFPSGGAVDAYSNTLYVPSGANTMLIDSFRAASSLPGQIYAVTAQYLSNSPATTLNITNFGAIGDEVETTANTVSNSPIITTAVALPSSMVGDSAEVFGAGCLTPLGTNSSGVYTNGNQDHVAIISVISGNTVTLSLNCSNTLTATHATFGFNNSAAIQACKNALPSGGTMLVPNMPFLCLSASNQIDSWFNPTNFNNDSNNKRDIYYSLVLTNAVNIVGQGPQSRIVGQGAWRDVVTTVISNGIPYYFTNVQRGAVFAILNQSGNSGSLIISNLIIDGGLPVGFTGHSKPPANTVDGDGWDETSDAVYAIGGYSPSTGNYPMFTTTTFTNCIFQHFRGEMLKTSEGSTNGYTAIPGCSFIDGNATAINWQEAGVVINPYFSNMLAGFEIGQMNIYSPWLFTGGFATNIWDNFGVIEIGMGLPTQPLFHITASTTYMANSANNDYWLGLPSAGNVLADSNTVHFTGGSQAFAIGNISGQASHPATNIVVANNTLYYPTTFSYIVGGANAGDTSHLVDGVLFSNNVVVETNESTFEQKYGWTANIAYVGTSYPSNNLALVNPDSNGAPYTNYSFIDIGNGYWSPINDVTDSVITLSYSHGSRYEVQSVQSGGKVVIGNSDALNIPAGAQCLTTNQNGNTFTLYMNTTNGVSLGVPSGSSALSYFLSGLWSTTLPLKSLYVAHLNVGSVAQ